VPQNATAEYPARIAARATARDALTILDARFAHARLATFAASVVLIVIAWRGVLPAWWLVLPAVLFAWLMQRHDRVLRARDEAARGIAFYERGLARIEDRWRGGGDTGERFRDDRHVYGNDLDLFGSGSLFELLSLARTRAGEQALASWLMSPAAAAEIRGRQDAVRELGPALDFREQLAIAGAGVRKSVQTDRLLEWAESPLPPRLALQGLTWAFSALVIAAVSYVLATAVWWPLAAVVVIQGLAFRRLRDQMNTIVSGRDPEATADFVADALTHRALDLDVLARLLTILERERFVCDRLRLLMERLSSDRTPVSRIIRRLHRYAEIHDSEKNAALVPLGFFLFGKIELALIVAALLQLLRPHVTLAVDRWRRRHGPQVRVWFDTIAQVEALTSLSAYHYEHAGDPFPEIVSGTSALFEGIELGHPLLPAASMVRNDVHLGVGTRLLVVSGSNMSGKSTLLRTVGINGVLALAGAPVRARSLRLSPLAIGATLRIQDSLLEGRSRFYAEITRIRELADMAAGPVPLLFLLDELFHGTNSHDRLAGASGVLRSLLDRGAVGLITTHDLALTAIADGLSPRARNVHFQDWFDGREMRFDYRMKPGPVTQSNALALMRAVGLDVPAAGEVASPP
jgi:hypothetical protein